jgi:hypothetical protein
MIGFVLGIAGGVVFCILIAIVVIRKYFLPTINSRDLTIESLSYYKSIADEQAGYKAQITSMFLNMLLASSSRTLSETAYRELSQLDEYHGLDGTISIFFPQEYESLVPFVFAAREIRKLKEMLQELETLVGKEAFSLKYEDVLVQFDETFENLKKYDVHCNLRLIGAAGSAIFARHSAALSLQKQPAPPVTES